MRKITEKDIELLLKPISVDDALFKEREPIYLVINTLYDRRQEALIEIQKEAFNAREMLRHEKAPAKEFVRLTERYKSSARELSKFFASKEVNALWGLGIKDLSESMGIFRAVRQLREDGRLPINSSQDVYSPEKDLFITRKTYESWGLSSEMVERVMAEIGQIDSSMKHYDFIN